MLLWVVDLIYNRLVIPVMGVLLWILKFFSERYAAYFSLQGSYQDVPVRQSQSSTKRIWFHASSLGEFEQSVEVINVLKERNPTWEVIVSWFSLSGYSFRHLYPNVSASLLLPLDSRSTARKVVLKLDADVVVFSRYDLWRNMVREIHASHIPMYLINATAPKLFKYPIVNRWAANTYALLSKVEAVSDLHRAAFAEAGIKASVLADTRYDRIISVVDVGETPYSCLNSASKPIVLMGSCWPTDVELLKRIRNQGLLDSIQFIFVPHQPEPTWVEKLLLEWGATRLDEVMEPQECSNVVVDTVGRLLSLYRLADAAWIGGGFGRGVHSVSEAAAYGIPLACGPAIQNSADAIEFANMSVLSVLQTPMDAEHWLANTVLSPRERTSQGAILADYIRSRTGSALKAVLQIEEMATSEQR